MVIISLVLAAFVALCPIPSRGSCSLCSPNAVCTNATDSPVVCTCAPGFRGDGFTCVPFGCPTYVNTSQSGGFLEYIKYVNILTDVNCRALCIGNPQGAYWVWQTGNVCNVATADPPARVPALGMDSGPRCDSAAVFTAGLSGRTGNTTSPGSGTVTLLVDPTQAALDVALPFSGLVGNATGATIHCCTSTRGSGTSGNATALLPAFPVGNTAGVYTLRIDMLAPGTYDPAFLAAFGGNTTAAWTALWIGIGNGTAYWSLDTAVYPVGEISGFFPPNPCAWCSANSVCNSTPSPATCICNAGYHGNGTTCDPLPCHTFVGQSQAGVFAVTANYSNVPDSVSCSALCTNDPTCLQWVWASSTQSCTTSNSQRYAFSKLKATPGSSFGYRCPGQIDSSTTLNPVEGTNSTGSGVAVVAATYTNATLSWTASFNGLMGETTMAHIHCCTAAPGIGTALPATPLADLPGFPLGVQTGNSFGVLNMSRANSYSTSFLFMNGNDPATAWFTLFNGIASGLAYFNVHTTSFPTGEIAGFFPITDVPSPSPVTDSPSPPPNASPVTPSGSPSSVSGSPSASNIQSPSPDPPVDCSACPSWCFASPRASPSPSPTPVPSPSPSPLCGCNPLGPLDPWAFQLVALGPVGSPGNPVVAYFGGAVLLSAPSFVNFQNINGDVIGNTLGTALAAEADVTFSGTSSSNMDLEVQGNLTNDGYWRGNVFVGGALVNDGVIQGNALSGNGCTGSCGPPQVSGTNIMGMHNSAVSVMTVQLYYSCLSLSVASLAPTVNFVSCSPTVAPTTCALAVSSGRNIANMYFSGITSIGIVGGDATTVLYLNVLDRGSVTYPAMWTFTSIKPSAVIVNVLYATALSGSVFHTPVIAQLATLTSTTTNVTAHSTMVVNSLAADITYYFAPTPTSLNTNAHACYQS